MNPVELQETAKNGTTYPSTWSTAKEWDNIPFMDLPITVKREAVSVKIRAIPRANTLYGRLYRTVDEVTRGHAALVVQLVSFLGIGGSASIVNLVIVFGLDRFNHLQSSLLIPNFVISAIATEISLVYNFALNDRYTFRLLADMRKTWLQRLLRFHLPASVGFLLTLLIATTLNTQVHLKLVIAQTIAILIVVFVNYAMHRFWTYRTHTPAVVS